MTGKLNSKCIHQASVRFYDSDKIREDVKKSIAKHLAKDFAQITDQEKSDLKTCVDYEADHIVNRMSDNHEYMINLFIDPLELQPRPE